MSRLYSRYCFRPPGYSKPFLLESLRIGPFLPHCAITSACFACNSFSRLSLQWEQTEIRATNWIVGMDGMSWRESCDCASLGASNIVDSMQKLVHDNFAWQTFSDVSFSRFSRSTILEPDIPQMADAEISPARGLRRWYRGGSFFIPRSKRNNLSNYKYSGTDKSLLRWALAFT